MQLVRAAVGDCLLRRDQVGLADRVALRVGIQQEAQFLQQGQHFRLVDIINMALAVEAAQSEPGRVVRQAGVFEIGIEHVQAEAIHAAFHPEAKRFQLRFADGRVAPVDVRLFFRE